MQIYKFKSPISFSEIFINISNTIAVFTGQTNYLFFMKNIYLYLCLCLLGLSMTSCEIIGDIFEAGIWVGVVGVALVIGLVLFIFGKMKG
jgi:hypothetical protein